MLSFGIFASGTPFFVMAGLYLFYMLVNLGAWINQSQEPADSDNKLVKQIEKSTWQESENDLSIYVCSAKDFQFDNHLSAIQSLPDNTGLWPPPHFCNRCIPDHLYINNPLIFRFFSRPPPVS